MGKDHLASKKTSKSHTTVCPAAFEPVKAADKLECVTKIILGLISPSRGGNGHRITFTLKNPKCIFAKVRGSGSIQDIYVHFASPEDRESVEEAMLAALPRT